MNNKNANRIYEEIKGLPIIDYHCHLSPQQIYEDKCFEDIGEIWLSCDHYKWRLMRAGGVREKLITGNATYEEKFNAFVGVVELAFGSPVKEWAELELEQYFDITLPLTSENASEIYNQANAVIKEKKLSPLKILEMSGVEYLATTDDIADDLKYHKLINDSDNCACKVVPTFRVDNILITDNYSVYLPKIADIVGYSIESLDSLLMAIEDRLKAFIACDCKFSDVGIQGFPTKVYDKVTASIVFDKLIVGDIVTDDEIDGYIGYIYLYLGGLYNKYNIIMQLHIAVARNINTRKRNEVGIDSGFDCMGDSLPLSNIAGLFDIMNNNDALPSTIIYALNPNMTELLINYVGAFERVRVGIPWWFNDHRRGMIDFYNTISEQSTINNVVGMVTDSRGFLSYARHQYFRKILAEYLSSFVDDVSYERVLKVAKNLSYYNAKNMIDM